MLALCLVGPDCFTIFEQCGRYWDGRVGGVLDPDQECSWNFPSGSNRVLDQGRDVSYSNLNLPLNLVPRDDVLDGIIASGDTVKIAEIHPAMRTF